jgi:hypothetical protein
MLALGLSSKREITRIAVRVRTAMAAQTMEQGRYLGGRPPYGYRLADARTSPRRPAPPASADAPYDLAGSLPGRSRISAARSARSGPVQLVPVIGAPQHGDLVP